LGNVVQEGRMIGKSRSNTADHLAARDDGIDNRQFEFAVGKKACGDTLLKPRMVHDGAGNQGLEIGVFSDFVRNFRLERLVLNNPVNDFLHIGRERRIPTIPAYRDTFTGFDGLNTISAAALNNNGRSAPPDGV